MIYRFMLGLVEAYTFKVEDFIRILVRGIFKSECILNIDIPISPISLSVLVWIV